MKIYIEDHFERWRRVRNFVFGYGLAGFLLWTGGQVTQGFLCLIRYLLIKEKKLMCMIRYIFYEYDKHK